MAGYYDSRLAAERLRKVYEIAPPRVRQYLEAEIAHVLARIRPGDFVLDLGCGYGRAIPTWAGRAALVVGVDTSAASLSLARQTLAELPNCCLINANALALPLPTGRFNLVACIQNGLSAFHVNNRDLVREAIRVTRPGGVVLFSTYSPKFWDHRLEWFRLQSAAGLLGEIDPARTGDGVIACKDGFTGRALRADALMTLADGLSVDARLSEVDESSLWLALTPR